jgi:hypothetical protein
MFVTRSKKWRKETYFYFWSSPLQYAQLLYLLSQEKNERKCQFWRNKYQAPQKPFLKEWWLMTTSADLQTCRTK